MVCPMHKMNGTIAQLVVHHSHRLLRGCTAQHGVRGDSDNRRVATVGGAVRRLYVQRTARNPPREMSINPTVKGYKIGDYLALGIVTNTLDSPSTFAAKDVVRIEIWLTPIAAHAKTFADLGEPDHAWDA